MRKYSVKGQNPALCTSYSSIAITLYIARLFWPATPVNNSIIDYTIYGNIA
jgi:hypothetical protein